VTLDRHVDRAIFGPLWLKDPRIAQLFRNAFWYGEQTRCFYVLRAWVIMPNHVHVLLKPKVPLPEITRWLKGSTARQANQVLGRTGNAFWQDESFDHWIRNDSELNRVVRYIEYNPVTAGFVQTRRIGHGRAHGWQAKAPAPLTLTPKRRMVIWQVP
jgi:hypothetical protein